MASPFSPGVFCYLTLSEIEALEPCSLFEKKEEKKKTQHQATAIKTLKSEWP